MHTTSRTFRKCGLCGSAALVLAGMALAAGCSTPEASEQTPIVNVQVNAAEVGTIQRKVDAEAILYPLDQAAIVPKITAPVSKFYVDRGSRVRAGQLLAELEHQDLASAATESQEILSFDLK